MSYCYVVCGTETAIVDVRSSLEKAIETGTTHMKKSGVNEWTVEEFNDETTFIHPVKYDTYEKVVIYRYLNH